MSDLDKDFGFGMGEACIDWDAAELSVRHETRAELDRMTANASLFDLDSRILAARLVV